MKFPKFYITSLNLILFELHNNLNSKATLIGELMSTLAALSMIILTISISSYIIFLLSSNEVKLNLHQQVLQFPQ